MSWPIVTQGGEDYYQFVGDILIPVEPDPVGQVASIILRPSGGAAGVGVPAIEQGDDGVPPELSTITVTELEYDDATPASATWTLSDPGPPPVYTLAWTYHKSAPPDPPDVVLAAASDVSGSPAVGSILVVDDIDPATTFAYTAQKVGDGHSPTTIANAPTGQAAYTLCTVGVPAYPFAWRPVVSGECVITGTGADVRCDLIARLDGTGGNIVGRGFGVIGTNASGIPTPLSSGPPAGSADAYDKVAANAAATIYLRVERQSGGDTFSTSATTTHFSVRVQPVP